MQLAKYFFTAVVTGLIVFSVIIGWRWWQVTNAPVPVFEPKRPEFTLNPPARALSGEIIQLEDGVMVETRDSDDPLQLELTHSLLEGEQLQTHQGSVTMQFTPDFQIDLVPETTLSFSSTDPAHFLLNQSEGTATYTLTPALSPVSVRTLHALFQFESGKYTLTIDPQSELIRLEIASGSGQIGYLDSENMTQVKTFSSEQTLEFDDEGREVLVLDE